MAFMLHLLVMVDDSTNKIHHVDFKKTSAFDLGSVKRRGFVPFSIEKVIVEASLF